MTRTIQALPLAAIALLTLSACELRRDESESAPAAEENASAEEGQDETPGSEPSQAPEESEEPVVSIIREDARATPPEEPVETVRPLEASVPFADGGIDLDADAQEVLRNVLDSAALREGWPVILRGHTDSSGNDSANMRASRARAEAVAAWLVERGVDDERIEVIAFGEQNPVAPNAKPDGTPDEEGRARNRRVDIEIAPAEEDAAESDDSSDEDA